MPQTKFDSFLSTLSSSEKAALQILLELPGKDLSEDDEKLLASHPWAGVILFSKNMKSAAQLKKLIQKIQSLNSQKFQDYPFFIAVDQEGGSVSPLEGLVSSSPGNMAIAAARNIEGAYRISRIVGSELRNLGFNVNFSPVLDVNTNPKNPIIGIRSFGENPEKVAAFGNAAIQGYQEEGILAVAKHFPGHGDTSKDSHLDLPVVNLSREELKKHLLPFQRGIQSGVQGMMSAHVIYPHIDSVPATLSHTFLTRILREEMGFSGIIFTDSLGMAAIQEHTALENAVIQSIQAGADVLLALGEFSTPKKVHSVLEEAIRTQKVPETQTFPSIRRILSARKHLGNYQAREKFQPEPNFIRSLYEQSVTLVAGQKYLPVSGKAEIFLTPEAATHLPAFRRHFPKDKLIPWPWPDSLLHSQNDRWIFFGEKRLLQEETREALQKIAPRVSCAVAFGNPYLLKNTPGAAVQITTYGFHEYFPEIVANVIRKGKQPKGKLPVTL